MKLSTPPLQMSIIFRYSMQLENFQHHDPMHFFLSSACARIFGSARYDVDFFGKIIHHSENCTCGARNLV